MTFEALYQQFLTTNLYPRELKNYEGKALINFSSNDYLGLAKHPQLIARAHAFSQRYGMSASSSRSVSGNIAIYAELEAQLAAGLNKPAALILGTGFQTNFSILEALFNSRVLGQEPRIFCDRLCHASMQMSAHQFAMLKRFQHNNLSHLEMLLEKFAQCGRPKFILAESLYSMDGDQADLPGLIQLAKKYGAFLYVDDAHAVGLYGDSGWGLAAQYAPGIDMIMGTFSKGLGSFGGYIACSTTLRDYLINKCKGLIYSTALPPAVLGAISAALEILPLLNSERERVLTYAHAVRVFFKQNQLACGGASSHIIPWIIGDAEKTLYASKLLAKEGILGLPIRPPSVAIGQCRIRFCVSATHTLADIQHLMGAIQKVEQKL